MTSKFFSTEDIPKKLADFKDMWFKIAQKTEALSNFRTGFDKGFKTSIKRLSSDLKRCELLVNNLCISCEHHLPDKKEDFEKLRRGLIDIFYKIRLGLEEDIQILEKHESLIHKIKETEKNLKTTIKNHEEAKNHALKTCSRYEAVKEGYLKKINNIKESTDEKIKKINSRFIADVENIFKGYNIFTREKNEKIGLDIFFERMIKDPDYYQKVNIVPKGFFLSKKKSDIEARLVLLRYKAKDITKEIAPIIDEETRRIARYREEERLMHELEIQCRDLKDREDKLSTRTRIIQSDLNALVSESEGSIRFQTYEKLLELKEAYARTFSDSTTLRKALETLITESFKEYEPKETDIEKRELKEEIKKLKQHTAALNNENTGLKKELENLKNELTKANADITHHKDTISALQKEKDALENKLQNRINDTRAELGEVSRNLAKVIKERDSLKDSLKKERQELKNQIKSLKKEKDSLENKLQNRINDTRAELEKVSRNLTETTGERDILKKEKKDLQKYTKTLEEEKTALHKEIEQLQSRAKKDKLLLEDKLRGVIKDLENTLDERDNLKESKKRLEDHIVHLETENQKLKKQIDDAVSKLETTIGRYEEAQDEIKDYKEKLREKEALLKDIKKNYEKIIVELDKPKPPPKAKKSASATKKQNAAKESKESDEKVVEKKIRALREKKRG